MSSRLETFVRDRCGQSVGLDDLKPFFHDEVYFNAKAEDPATSGISGSALTIPMSITPIGHVVVFYANATDERLQRPFAGVRLDEALEIASVIEGAAGVAIQSARAEALLIEMQSLSVLPHRGKGISGTDGRP